MKILKPYYSRDLNQKWTNLLFKTLKRLHRC